MKTFASFRHARLWLQIKLPVAMLVTLLQRTPVVRVVAVADDLVAASPLGAVLRSAFAAAATLGTLHSLAGATTLVTTQTSPASATVGTAITPVGFTVSNTINIASWKVGGTLPPGLVLGATQGGATLTGPGVLDATTPGMSDGGGYGGYGGGTVGGNSTTTPVLTGTPTQAGSYMFTLQAFEYAGLMGLASDTFSYTINVGGNTPSNVAPTITLQPQSQAAGAGASVTLSAGATAANGNPAPTYQWQQNGTALSGATGATLTLANIQPANAGIYTVVVVSGGTSTTTPAIVGLLTTNKVIGAGSVVGTDIVHPNGNIFDQVLVTGAAESITADAHQVTRTSYIDLNDDIVQVEFSGAGTLSLVLASPSGPAAPLNYNQPTVAYMKGHAGIVITGADDTTNVSVFTVGRATAFDPTGTYNILLSPSATNDPTKNGSSLFAGHDTTHYDGFADIAYIAIASTNGKFGGLRASNAHFFASNGLTGVYAPGVAFEGPVFVSNIEAFDAASPVLILGSASDTRVTGGDMFQDNGQAVQVNGVTQLKFTAGSDSAGTIFPAQNNRGVFKQNGTDVTAQIVVQP